MTVWGTLAASGGPVLGVGLVGLLTRGFSWGDLGALVVLWAFLFLLVLSFEGRLRPTRGR